MSSALKRSPWFAYLLLSLTALFWSGNFVLGRGIRELIPPISLNFYRWAGALVILLAIAWPRIRKQKQLLRQHWKLIALLSIPSIAIFNTCIYTALQSTTATNTVLVNATTPIFIAVILWLFYGDRLSARQAVGVLASLCGLVFIISRGDADMLKSMEFTSGDLWTLGAAISWAVYTVWLRYRPAALDPLAFLTILVAFGLIFLSPFYLWELFTKGGFQLSTTSILSMIYVSLFPSVLAYIFWNHGVRQIGANRAGIFMHLMPVYSILLAILFLDEQLRVYHLTGMGLIFAGIVMTTLPSPVHDHGSR